jgi:hypothetical protein
VLDVGRTRRLFVGALRHALELRDGGCAFPGCDRPPRWCQARITSGRGSTAGIPAWTTVCCCGAPSSAHP